jgi:dephospho-CoA kinase
LKIGITGGIGAGNSIVSDLIESEGYIVLRSDLIAKDLMQNDETVKKKLIEVFGEQTFLNEKLKHKIPCRKCL